MRDDGEIVRIDAVTGEIDARIPTGGQPWPITFAAGSVWAAELEGQLLQIDPASNEIIGRADVGPLPHGVATGLGAIWVTSQSGTVTRVPIPR